MWVIAIPIGFTVGLSLGALGGGGSILTVPALVYLLSQNAHGATTASLVIVGVTALFGMIAHARARRVRFADGLLFGALGVAGSVAGSRLSEGIDSNVLLAAFAVLMLVAAGAMARRSMTGVRRAVAVGAPSADSSGGTIALPTQIEVPAPSEATCDVRGPVARTSRITVLRVVAAASVVGLITGFFGVGGGFVVVPALVLALGFDMPEAVGTSLLVIAVNSAFALVARVGSHVHVDFALVGIFVLGAVAGSLAGSRLAGLVRSEMLTRSFTVLLVLVALYTMARSLPRFV